MIDGRRIEKNDIVFVSLPYKNKSDCSLPVSMCSHLLLHVTQFKSLFCVRNKRRVTNFRGHFQVWIKKNKIIMNILLIHVIKISKSVRI